VLPKLSTLSSELQLIVLVGYNENAGHKLVSESAAEEFEAGFVKAVCGAPPEKLMKEWDLLRVLYLAQEKLPTGKLVLSVTDDLELNAKVLTSARSEVLSQAMGSRAVIRRPRLQWDVLIAIYGDEATLSGIVRSLKESQPEDQALAEAIALAERYVAGWRPAPFSDDD